MPPFDLEHFGAPVTAVDPRTEVSFRVTAHQREKLRRLAVGVFESSVDATLITAARALHDALALEHPE